VSGWAIVPRGTYPEDWPLIARGVKDEARWRCVRCDAAHSREGWRILTVHHLNGIKDDCRWWNLLALCQRCHLSIQGRVNPERPWVMTEHTPWFRPYVAGFYAAKYLGVDLERAEVMERLDELLGLERLAVLGGIA
jgi:5-methylcytosine-specific restriction endonuclease McrA